jgi:uncharacterized protein YuzE
MIRSRFDLNADALYLAVTDEPVAEAVQLEHGALVDVTADGSVVGIEILSPTRCLPYAEILDRFEFAPDDEAVLRALAAPASGGTCSLVTLVIP